MTQRWCELRLYLTRSTISLHHDLAGTGASANAIKPAGLVQHPAVPAQRTVSITRCENDSGVHGHTIPAVASGKSTHAVVQGWHAPEGVSGSGGSVAEPSERSGHPLAADSHLWSQGIADPVHGHPGSPISRVCHVLLHQVRLGARSAAMHMHADGAPLYGYNRL